MRKNDGSEKKVMMAKFTNFVSSMNLDEIIKKHKESKQDKYVVPEKSMLA
jgi:hypothetical protein